MLVDNGQTRPASNGVNEEKVKEGNTEETLAATPGVSAEVLEAAEEIVPVAVEVVSKTAGKRQFKENRRRPRKVSRREDRPRSEFEQKIVSIRRVTRVVAGGRRMSFSVALVAGNRKGRVGIGTGKAADTSLAIDKAFRDAKKKMINIPLTKTNSIPHDTKAKYAASTVAMIPSRGRGLVAGGSVRSVLELAGVTDITAKLLSRSKNALNNSRAAIKALQGLRQHRPQE